MLLCLSILCIWPPCFRQLVRILLRNDHTRPDVCSRLQAQRRNQNGAGADVAPIADGGLVDLFAVEIGGDRSGPNVDISSDGGIAKVAVADSETVFVDVKPDMSIYREEIFGPVVTAVAYDDMDELIDAANDTTYGLMAGIWTKDISKAHTLAAAIQAGKVTINNYDAGDPAFPFGGFKQSGWGREMGHYALELYTETKGVVVGL